MLKIITVAFIITLLVPQIASAVWWNPFSWFQSDTKSEVPKHFPDSTVQTEESDARTIFYTKSTANFRQCPSIDCKVITRFPDNSTFLLNYSSLSEFPEWVPILDTDGTEGFMHKSVFSLVPIEKQVEGVAGQVFDFSDDPEIVALKNEIEKVESELRSLNKTPTSDLRVNYQKEEIIQILRGAIQNEEKLQKQYLIEIDFLDEVYLALNKFVKNARIDNFKTLTKARKDRLVNSHFALSNFINKEKELLSFYESVNGNYFESIEYNQVRERLLTYLKNSRQRLEDFANESDQYQESFESIKSYVESSDNIRSPSPSSTLPIPVLRGETDCGSIQGVTICGDTNFNPDDYTIVTSEDSYGGTLYKVVPPAGAKVPNLGYFDSEEKAVASYKTWLKNNGY